MRKIFTKYATLTHPETGVSQTFEPGDESPDWADVDKLNPAVFEDDEPDTDEDGNPENVAGPGVTGAPDETEDEAKERKAAEAKRKRDQRAAKKAADEEAQRLADEREAAEKAAADEAQRQQDAAGQQGQGGGS